MVISSTCAIVRTPIAGRPVSATRSGVSPKRSSELPSRVTASGVSPSSATPSQAHGHARGVPSAGREAADCAGAGPLQRARRGPRERPVDPVRQREPRALRHPRRTGRRPRRRRRDRPGAQRAAPGRSRARGGAQRARAGLEGVEPEQARRTHHRGPVLLSSGPVGHGQQAAVRGPAHATGVSFSHGGRRAPDTRPSPSTSSRLPPTLERDGQRAGLFAVVRAPRRAPAAWRRARPERAPRRARRPSGTARRLADRRERLPVGRDATRHAATPARWSIASRSTSTNASVEPASAIPLVRADGEAAAEPDVDRRHRRRSRQATRARPLSAVGGEELLCSRTATDMTSPGVGGAAAGARRPRPTPADVGAGRVLARRPRRSRGRARGRGPTRCRRRRRATRTHRARSDAARDRLRPTRPAARGPLLDPGCVLAFGWRAGRRSVRTRPAGPRPARELEVRAIRSASRLTLRRG